MMKKKKKLLKYENFKNLYLKNFLEKKNRKRDLKFFENNYYIIKQKIQIVIVVSGF